MQKTLFQEILTRKLTVRDAEQVARRIATERARKSDLTPELLLLERELTEKLGTRVRIEKKDQGGKVLIDFFSVDDLIHIREVFTRQEQMKVGVVDVVVETDVPSIAAGTETPVTPPQTEPEEDLYSIKNFTV